MNELGYLERLTLRLTIGAAQLPDSVRDPHLNYILAQQKTDGGWGGREGGSDVYYTSFALRTLAFTGLLEGEVAERSADFLRKQLTLPQGIVDLLALIYSVKLLDAAIGLDVMTDARSDWAERLADLLSKLRREDGGYAKSFEGVAGSTYQTFLVLLCLELIGVPVPEPEKVLGFLNRHRHPEGGFLEIRVGKKAGANPTAAAIGALQVLGKLDEATANECGEFLADLQTDGGGFQANTRIPLPDVLSTFTATLTLADLDRAHWIKPDAVEKYLDSMARPEGGFAGFEFDPGQDVEYTFYGLGGLSLLKTLE